MEKNLEAVALEWLVQHLGYPRKGLEAELAKLLKKVRDEALVSVGPARAASENAPSWVFERGSDMCRCCCRCCAEDDHCGEGRQEGLGDCLHPKVHEY